MNSPDSVITMPLKPTWERYVDIFLRRADISIYRALEYEALSSLSFNGRVLDFGGGERAHYLSHLKSLMHEGAFESVNISSDMKPTYLIAPGDPFPVEDGSYDMVISINTLEHVFDLAGALAEMMRVLKPGGRAVLAVPFLFRMHGCPDDYNRPTASWWREALPAYGLTNLNITPLVWDVLTSGLSVTEGAAPFAKLRRLLVPLFGLVYAQIKAGGSGERYPAPVGEALANVALGYVITGVKK